MDIKGFQKILFTFAIIFTIYNVTERFFTNKVINSKYNA